MRYKFVRSINDLPPGSLYLLNTSTPQEINPYTKFKGIAYWFQIHDHSGSDVTYKLNGKTLTCKANAKETFDNVEIDSFELVTNAEVDIVFKYFNAEEAILNQWVRKFK